MPFYTMTSYEITVAKEDYARFASDLAAALGIKPHAIASDLRETPDGKSYEVTLADAVRSGEFEMGIGETAWKKLMARWCRQGSFVKLFDNDALSHERVVVDYFWHAKAERVPMADPWVAREEKEKLEADKERFEYRSQIYGGLRVTNPEPGKDANLEPGVYPATSDSPWEITQSDVENSFDPELVEVEKAAFLHINDSGKQSISEIHLTDDEESPNGLGWYHVDYEWVPEKCEWVDFYGGLWGGYQNADEVLAEAQWSKDVGAGNEVWSIPIDYSLLWEIGIMGGIPRRVKDAEVTAAILAEVSRLENLCGLRATVIDELADLNARNAPAIQEANRLVGSLRAENQDLAVEHRQEIRELESKLASQATRSAFYEHLFEEMAETLGVDTHERSMESIAYDVKVAANVAVANRDELARTAAKLDDELEALRGPEVPSNQGYTAGIQGMVPAISSIPIPGSGPIGRRTGR